MRILILGGFLGSGKTTALMRLARYLAERSAPARASKVVILENEIGEVGIDDQFLRGGGFSVSNLFAGCACCTVSGELISAAARIERELEPEWLVVETTGVAYPKDMRENIRGAMGEDARIVILVDASRWRRIKIPMRALLAGQLEGSDCVLINKIDLVSPEELLAVERDVLELEPSAELLRISAAFPVADEVWEKAAGGA